MARGAGGGRTPFETLEMLRDDDEGTPSDNPREPLVDFKKEGLFTPDQPLFPDMIAGSYEEWTVVNPSFTDHPFHIHQNHFPVTKTNGQPLPVPEWHDTIIVPGAQPQPTNFTGPHLLNTNKIPYGSITFRMYLNPVSVGCFVMHCHILTHEDLGMMQRLDVWPAQVRRANATRAESHTKLETRARCRGCMRWLVSSPYRKDRGRYASRHDLAGRNGLPAAVGASCSATGVMASRIASSGNVPERAEHCLTRMLLARRCFVNRCSVEICDCGCWEFIEGSRRFRSPAWRRQLPRTILWRPRLATISSISSATAARPRSMMLCPPILTTFIHGRMAKSGVASVALWVATSLDARGASSGKGRRRSKPRADASYPEPLASASGESRRRLAAPHCFSRTHWAMGHAPALMVMHRQRRRVGNDNGEHHSAILVHEDVAVHDISPAVIDETASHLEVTWDGFLGCRLIRPC
jgi:hypothetical protein